MVSDFHIIDIYTLTSAVPRTRILSSVSTKKMSSTLDQAVDQFLELSRDFFQERCPQGSHANVQKIGEQAAEKAQGELSDRAFAALRTKGLEADDDADEERLGEQDAGVEHVSEKVPETSILGEKYGFAVAGSLVPAGGPLVESTSTNKPATSNTTSTTGETADPTGRGLLATKPFQQFDTILRDTVILRHTGRFTMDACEKWFWEELDVPLKKRVLSLKRFPLAVMFDQDAKEMGGKVFTDEDVTAMETETVAALEEVLNNAGDSFPLLNAHQKHLVTLAAYAGVRANAIRDREAEENTANYVPPPKNEERTTSAVVEGEDAGPEPILVLCPTAAMFNHGCEPNLWHQGAGRFLALRNIQAGEELLWCYAQGQVKNEWTSTAQHFLLMDKEARNKHLAENYSFQAFGGCGCNRCKNSTSPLEKSLKTDNDKFITITSFVEANSSGDICQDSDKWVEVLDLAQELVLGPPSVKQGLLALDFKYVCQVATLSGVFQSFRLLMIQHHGLENFASVEDDLKEHLDVVDSALVDEIKWQGAAFGRGSGSRMRELIKVFERFYWAKMLVARAGKAVGKN